MALNYPGPFDLRFFYSTTVTGVLRNHVMKLNCNIDALAPGESFGGATVLTRGGATPALDDAVDAWVTLWLAAYPSTAFALSHVEAWQYETNSFAADFVSSYTIAATGVGGNSLTPAGQYIHTYRTQEGGIMKLSFMEPPVLSGVTDPPPLAATGMQAIADFVVSSANWILARDTSYPFALIGGYPGINEALFKNRYRP